jgi:predicted dehydrogenase
VSDAEAGEARRREAAGQRSAALRNSRREQFGTASEPLRIGLASFAHVHAARYAEILRDRDDVELRVADPDAGRASDAGAHPRGAELADRLGVELVDSYAELLDWCSGVLVCSETAWHRQLVEQAAAAGTAVLCEKPLATMVSDATAMVRACADAGVPLMTAYPVRLHPDFVALRAAVQAGRIGRVLSAQGTNNGQAPFTDRAWFADRELAGGGALADHTVHLADLLHLLLESPATSVYAQTNSILHGAHPLLAAGAIDTGGLVVVDYADGTVATIDCSWSAPDSYPAWGGLTLALHGENGAARFDAFSHRLELFDDSTGSVRWPGFGTDLDALLLDEFVDVVRTGRPGQPDGLAGLRTLALVEAAYASARSGLPEPVQQIG